MKNKLFMMFVLIFMSTVSFANEQASIVVRGTGQVFQDNGVYYADIGGTHYRLDKRTILLDPGNYHSNTAKWMIKAYNKKAFFKQVRSGDDITVFGFSTLPVSVYDFVWGEASQKDIAKFVEKKVDPEVKKEGYTAKHIFAGIGLGCLFFLVLGATGIPGDGYDGI